MFSNKINIMIYHDKATLSPFHYLQFKTPCMVIDKVHTTHTPRIGTQRSHFESTPLYRTRLLTIRLLKQSYFATRLDYKKYKLFMVVPMNQWVAMVYPSATREPICSPCHIFFLLCLPWTWHFMINLAGVSRKAEDAYPTGTPGPICSKLFLLESGSVIYFCLDVFHTLLVPLLCSVFSWSSCCPKIQFMFFLLNTVRIHVLILLNFLCDLYSIFHRSWPAKNILNSREAVFTWNHNRQIYQV